MKISIVVATFNSEATLRSTLDSILRQTWTDYEVLLQDGTSTDGTLAIVQEYEPLFSGKLILESKRDKGIYDGLNNGIERATGDVIGFLNSDDFYTSNNVLSSVVRNFEQHPELDAVYADVHYVKPDRLDKIARYYSSERFTPQMMLRGYMPAHPTFYARRECYEKYGSFDLQFKVASDFEYLLRLIYIHRIKTRYVAEDWVTMRLGGASTNGLKSHLVIEKDHFRAFRKHQLKVSFFANLLRYVEKLKEFL